MDPDAEVARGASSAFSRANFATAALFGGLIGTGIALRVMRFSVGDYYEDGAAHWWAAARATQTGTLVDTFNYGTSGYWLPGYDHLAVAVMQAAGSTEIVVLRTLGVAFFVAAAFAVLSLARMAGTGVALLAVAFFALSPFDILNAPIAIGMEPAVAFMAGGLAMVFQSRRGKPTAIYGAAVLFSMAVLFRYEALPFVGVILVHNWWWSASRPLMGLTRKREAPFLLTPLAIAALYLALTWGNNFPSRLLGAGPNAPELGSTEAFAFIPSDPLGRNAAFWSFWAGAAPAAIAFAALGTARYFRRAEAWLVAAFVFLMTVFLFLNLGTPSVRYLMPVEPLLWFLAALGVWVAGQRVAAVAARLRPGASLNWVRPIAGAALGALVLSSGLVTSAAAFESVDQRIALHGPLYRAADFVASLPQDETKLVLIDSPLAAEASGLSPARLIGSGFLPDDRETAMAFIRGHVQYVVAVNVSYYKLITFFPELGRGRSSENFSMLYDASGWEFDYTGKTAFVYRVNHGSGALPVADDLTLSFPFHEADAWGNVTGLHLLYRGENITAGARGIGYPTIETSSERYRPAAIDAQFTKEAPVREVRANYTLYPESSTGRLETYHNRTVVSASFRLEGGSVLAWFRVVEPPPTSSFTLRVNNSVPSGEFGETFNDSLIARTSAPFAEGLVWSLQNWLLGPRAALQFDFTAPSNLSGARQGGGAAWVAYEGAAGSEGLYYPFHVRPADAELFGVAEPLLLKAPVFRAAGFLATAPRNGSHQILSDFAFGPYPWLLEGSGLPQGAFVNTSAVPGTRQAAIEWLVATVDYVVAINVSADPFISTFPELANGDSTQEFSLVFDASGGPGSLSHGLVWVYSVNRGGGLVPAHLGAYLEFPFTQDTGAPTVLGFGISVNGTQAIRPAAGLGVPSAFVNGTPYGAGIASLAFVAGSGGTGVSGTFALFPLENGTPNRSQPPLVVRAAYSFAEGVLSASFEAEPASPADNVTLSAGVSVQGADFPVYINDTDNAVSSGEFSRGNVWALRNWLIGPVVVLQVDFHDPYQLFYAREFGGDASLEYEGPAGARTMSVSVWVLPRELGPAF